MESVGSETKTGGSYLMTPLLLSLAGIVGTSIAIVAYHIIVVKLCMRRQRRRATTSQSRPMQEGHQGVEEDVLKAIPIYCFSTDNRELQLRVDQSECVICLGELQEGDRVRLLPNCGHLFHASCIDDWFLAHTSCPVCRAPIDVAPMISTCSVHDQSVNDVRESQNSVNDDQFIVQQGDGHNFNGSGTSRHSKNHLLGHSLSLVLPREGQKSQPFMGLKRSLSMDHQSYVIVDIQRDDSTDKASSSCTSNSSLKGTVLIKSGSFGARSMRQLDRMSSKLLRSFSQLRIGRGASNVILPY